MGLQWPRCEVTRDDIARRSTATAHLQSVGTVRVVHRLADAHGGQAGPMSVPPYRRRQVESVRQDELKVSLSGRFAHQERTGYSRFTE